MPKVTRNKNNSACWILTFPFWLYLDKKSSPPETKLIKYKDKKCRIYCPFRTSPANFINMPIPSSSVIPNATYEDERFRKNAKHYSMATIPRMDKDPQGGSQILIQMGEKWDEKPNPFPMDSLRIDIEDSWGEPASQNLIKDLTDKLLNWTRILSHQWWINRDIASLAGYNRCVIGKNHNGKFNTYPQLTGTQRTFYGFEKPITKVLWHKIVTKVANEELWQQHEIFLLDAYLFLAKGDFRASIMSIALALETYTEYTFKRLWDAKAEDVSFNRGRLMSSDLRSNITSKMNKYFGKTYKKANDSFYEDIEELWLMRHQVAHGQPIISIGKNKVKEEDIKRVIKAAKHCLEWLKNL